MKIGLIVRTMNVSGGVERQAIMLAHTLESLGQTVVFIRLLLIERLVFQMRQEV